MRSEYKGYFLEEFNGGVLIYKDADSWRAQKPSYGAPNEQEALSWIDKQKTEVGGDSILLNFAQELVESKNFGGEDVSYYLTPIGHLGRAFLTLSMSLDSIEPPKTASLRAILGGLLGESDPDLLDEIAQKIDNIGIEQFITQMRVSHAPAFLQRLFQVIRGLLNAGIIGRITNTDFSFTDEFTLFPASIMAVLDESAAHSPLNAVSNDFLYSTLVLDAKEEGDEEEVQETLNKWYNNAIGVLLANGYIIRVKEGA